MDDDDRRGRATCYARGRACYVKLVPDRRHFSGLRFALQRERAGQCGAARIRKIRPRRDPEKRESDSIRGL